MLLLLLLLLLAAAVAAAAAPVAAVTAHIPFILMPCNLIGVNSCKKLASRSSDCWPAVFWSSSVHMLTIMG